MCLFLCMFMGFGFKNIVRSRAGRAYAGIRDGDIAAEALGVNLFRYKASAFALASFYAGVGGAMASTISGGVEPGSFNLLFSILAVAIIALVLLQQGKGSDLGSAFGGGSSNSMFGALGPSDFLGKLTYSLVALWLVLTLALAYLYKTENTKEIFETPLIEEVMEEIPTDEIPTE